MRSALYIPHGSDERKHRFIGFDGNFCFISHMVQMKVTVELDNEMPLHPLYPTWFRWKIADRLEAEDIQTPLYPTWFRWKCTVQNGQSFLIKLYIPHGSDESQIAGNGKEVVVTFISHMVQMKVSQRLPPNIYPISFISHMVQMKASICFKHGLCMKYFISHMVQMKGYDRCLLWPQVQALYPTWFRWKGQLSKSY